MWFTSFNLAQGYLQMAMEEEDMKKTAFRAGSSGLYEFGLTNAGASFCHLMEMCIGDQQYITLLFYLDDICVFVETAYQMLDRIQFTFSGLKEFNLQAKDLHLCRELRGEEKSIGTSSALQSSTRSQS